MDKEIYNFKNVDPSDIDDVLTRIEKSFDISLKNKGLEHIKTFRDLSNLIVETINLDHDDSCTCQQAFYKLRNAIVVATGIDKCSIKPQTRLAAIFPREDRLRVISEIENELGFKINALQPKSWVIILFSLILAVSFIICFFILLPGLAGLLFSVAGLKLAGKFGKELHLKTVGDMANKISRESYLRSRRNHCSINRNEVEQKVKELFINDLHLEPVVLTRRSTR